jgi:chemotaxis protein CheC
MQSDALRELCSMGSGNAVGALSRLLGRAVTVDVPRTLPLRRSALAAELETGEPWVAVEFLVQGEVQGQLVLLLPASQALGHASLMLGRESDGLGELERDALSEMGNIVASSFLDTVARVTRLWLQPSVPTYREGAASELVMSLHQRGAEEPPVVFESQWAVRGKPGLSGRLWVFPDADTVPSLLAGLGL